MQIQQSKTCYRHPQSASVGFCVGCGQPICPTCLTIFQERMYCPICYAVVEITNTEVAERKAKKKKWYFTRSFVLSMLFLVAGPFALPLLWGSPNFSLVSKLILTILVIILTIIVIWLCYEVYVLWSPRIRELFQVLQQTG